MNINAQFGETGGTFEVDIGQIKEISVVDQIYSPSSENAQSGIAVAAALSKERLITNASCANALRDSASGETINLTDVSPNEHTLTVKLKNKNLFDISTVIGYQSLTDLTYQAHYGSISDDRVITCRYSSYAGGAVLKDWKKYITAGAYTVSVDCYYPTTNGSTDYKIIVDLLQAGSKVNARRAKTITPDVWARLSFTIDITTDGEYYMQLQPSGNAGAFYPLDVKFKNIQLEEGSTATSYVPYISDFSTVNVTRHGKNLMPYPYAYTTQTISGVTFTVNSDGSITVNGTATANAAFELETDLQMFALPAADYFLSGCPSGGSTSTYFMTVANGAGATYTKFLRDFGNGISVPSVGENWKVSIRIMSGYTANNLVFKPQIELGTTATEYEPYKAPTEYTPAADGTVSGITSLYPTATLMTDTAGVIIDAEYNRDINKAFAALEAAIAANNS